MAFISSQSAGVLVNEFDLTSYFTKVEPVGERVMLDVTTLGQSSPAFQPGLRNGGFLAEGFYDQATAAASDSVLSPLLTASTLPLVAGAPQGFGTVGNRVYLLQAHQEKYALGMKMGGFVSNMALFRSNDGFDAGVVLHALASRSTSGNGTSVDNGSATTNGGVFQVHVTAAASADFDVELEHSSDNSSWASLGNAVAVSGVTSARVTVAAGTTVNRYVRVVWTRAAGSMTFAAAFARR